MVIFSLVTAAEALAQPTRREILDLLREGERPVGDLVELLDVSQPAVSKHLRVLREAGFVESTVDAQRRLYRLNPDPLREVNDWLAQFRRFWSGHVDALERHLDRMNQTASTKPKQKSRRRS
jgi:DNA-binding transcriptional ArsR family regulator